MSLNLIKLLPTTFTLAAGLGSTDSLPFQIYPNPCDDVVNFKTKANEKISNISVFDLTGKTVYKISGERNSLNIKNLIRGIYFLVIETNQNKYKLKVLKK